MTGPAVKTMRDALIERIYDVMARRDDVFFVSADMGAPMLDRLRVDFRERFVNVGIAEQNMVNVATGLALEGHCVFAYLIAPFVLRAFEQIRIDLALSAQSRALNVNLIGVGSGVSYDASGPTHHCLEDLSVMRTLPNIDVFAPSDWVMARHFADYALDRRTPKYARLDGKPLASLYPERQIPPWRRGFVEWQCGESVCLLATGYAAHVARAAAAALTAEGVRAGGVDLFLHRPFDQPALASTLARYRSILTLEEGFAGKGGLDSLIRSVTAERPTIAVRGLGFPDAYLFDFGSREHLYSLAGCGVDRVVNEARRLAGS
jgi:transketolase